MAVNDSRSMNEDFHQGAIDSSYISLTPDRGCVENPPVERLGWHIYQHAEMFKDDPHIEAEIVRSTRPVEHLRGPASVYGDPRY